MQLKEKQEKWNNVFEQLTEEAQDYILDVALKFAESYPAVTNKKVALRLVANNASRRM